MIAKTRMPTRELAREFGSLVLQWRSDTSHLSSVSKMSIHPAYQRIIGMGPIALPLILNELRRKPGHWFWALNAISGEDPVKPGESFQEAVASWLRWGEDKGYI